MRNLDKIHLILTYAANQKSFNFVPFPSSFVRFFYLSFSLKNKNKNKNEQVVAVFNLHTTVKLNDEPRE